MYTHVAVCAAVVQKDVGIEVIEPGCLAEAKAMAVGKNSEGDRCGNRAGS